MSKKQTKRKTKKVSVSSIRNIEEEKQNKGRKLENVLR